MAEARRHGSHRWAPVRDVLVAEWKMMAKVADVEAMIMPVGAEALIFKKCFMGV